jgi:hypothetical protein
VLVLARHEVAAALNEIIVAPVTRTAERTTIRPVTHRQRERPAR